MENHTVYTLDLYFRGRSGTIAAYLIPHSAGAALIECGPGSTLPALQSALAQHHFTVKDVTHVFLTHIHLDHAGAAGWLARQGANIYVHPVGAPHLINPEKLLTSATRLYGDQMDMLWGEFLPVPPEKLHVLQDGEVVEFDQIRLRALETPGHASHHFVYFYDGICFSGDIGGVRLFGKRHIRIPVPPPEFQLDFWRQSLKRLQAESFTRIAPTHFGIYSDREEHFAELWRGLERIETWMEAVMPSDPPLETLRQQFAAWELDNSMALGIDESIIREYEIANPSYMSADGIQRYWKKYRQPPQG